MAHASGNATWQDYPATTTPVTAAKLEAIENRADALYASEYGAGRTKATVFHAYPPSTFALPATTDVFADTAWSADVDLAAGYHSGSPSYYEVPISGRRWDCLVTYNAAALTSGGTLTCKITRNAADVGRSIAADARQGTGGECNVYAFGPGIVLSAGDRLYWSVWCSHAVTIGWTFGFVTPEFVVRDVGPS